MNTGTFIRRFMASLPQRSGWLVLPAAGWQPQHRVLSGGYELRHDEVYDWSEAQRTDEPMASIQLTISGEGRLRVGGRDYRVGPGQAMVLRSDEPHRYWLPSGGRWEFVFLSVVGADVMTAIRHAIARGGYVQEFTPDGPFLSRYLSTIRSLIRSEIMSHGQSCELAVGVVTALVDDVDRRGRSHSGIERAKLLIQQRLTAPPSLMALAKIAGLSRSSFCAAFTASEGMSPGRWLRDKRLLAAAARLRSGATAAEVAKEFGYPDPAYFGRAFRQRFGLPPARWRRLNPL